MTRRSTPRSAQRAGVEITPGQSCMPEVEKSGFHPNHAVHGVTLTQVQIYRLTRKNWQSDLMRQAALIILPAYLLYKQSSESRDSDDETEEALERFQQALASG